MSLREELEISWIPDETTPCYTDPDAWSDPVLHKEDRAIAYQAKRICRRQCHLRLECLDAGLKQDQGKHWSNRYGIWGGFSPKERSKLDEGLIDVEGRPRIGPYPEGAEVIPLRGGRNAEDGHSPDDEGEDGRDGDVA